MARYFKCTTNKSPIAYKCDEKMVFTITARETAIDIACNYVKWVIRTDDGKQSEGFSSIEPRKPLVLESSISRPGFVRVTCTAYTGGNAVDGSFDVLEASAGAEVEKLEYLDTIPDDFDDYWREIEQKVADFPVNVVSCEPVTQGVKKGFKVYDVRIMSPEGRNASGYVTIPDKQGKFPIKAVYIGYAICGANLTYNEDTITGCFNAHGIENDINRFEAARKYGEELKDYGLRDEVNASNMTTYWREVMIRNLIAVKYLKTLPQWDGKNFISAGGSQGAFQATTVAAHDKDVTFLDVAIPWFCNLNAENNGYMAGWRAHFAEGLRYFDTVAQATRVKCPVKIFAKLGDYVCPPSTTLTLYNSFKGNKSIDLLQAGTHGYNPPERDMFYLRYDPQNPTGEVKKGKYRHFKGNEYEVIDIGFDSETCEEVVIYKALYGDGNIWVRPKYMFLEYTFHNNEYIKRFEFIG